MLCDYGCNQEANFQFSNGKRCCSKHRSSCPNMKHKFQTKTSKLTAVCEVCGKIFSLGSIASHRKSCKSKKCLTCGKTIFSKNKYCSHQCAGKMNGHKGRENTSRTIGVSICLTCGKNIKSKRFCDNTCKGIFNENQKIFQWLSGDLSGGDKMGAARFVRSWLFKINNNKCSICGWSSVNVSSGMIPLEVDHIDGNSENNELNNLRLICPNCHSLTSTYKALNKSSSRTQRKTKNY